MSFPVDDTTLDAIDRALQDSDYTLSDLLNFLSGYNPDQLELLEGTGWLDAPIYTYPEALYSEHDVIKALIAEVRRLRETHEKE